jgi:hypothetical protein
MVIIVPSDDKELALLIREFPELLLALVGSILETATEILGVALRFGKLARRWTSLGIFGTM